MSQTPAEQLKAWFTDNKTFLPGEVKDCFHKLTYSDYENTFGSNPNEFLQLIKKVFDDIDKKSTVRITVNNERIYQFDNGLRGAQCIGQYNDNGKIQTWICDRQDIINNDDFIIFGNDYKQSIKIVFGGLGKIIRVECCQGSPWNNDSRSQERTINFNVEYL